MTTRAFALPLWIFIATSIAFADVSALFDDEDNLHVAFTTTLFHALEDTVSAYASQLWHWDEERQLFTPIRAVGPDYLSEHWADNLGCWEFILQRPTLALDPITGDLFCSYQFSDIDQWSEWGIPQADAWVSRSTDDGLHWSEGVNVTATDGGQNTPSGECSHERDITLAGLVSYEDGAGYLTMQYILDVDAGCSVGENPTGTPTLNQVNLLRIPIDEIPSTPLVDWCSPELHVDGTGSPCTESIETEGFALPRNLTLYQNYPNPFNPSTTIQFDLVEPAVVSLAVHDVLGREIVKLIDNERFNPGTQLASFDGSALPSGIYFYRLQTGSSMQSQKMILLK